MAYSTVPLHHQPDHKGAYVLQAARPENNYNHAAVVQNPFLSTAEMSASVGTAPMEPVEEYDGGEESDDNSPMRQRREEVEEEEEAEEEREEEDMRKTASGKAIRHPHPYGRSMTSTSTKSAASQGSTSGSQRRTTRMNLLTPPNSNGGPPIICLHGTNDSCMRSWLSMVETLYKSGHTILLYDRPPPDALGGADLKPHRAVSELCSYLYSVDRLRAPYVFIAHGYGACVARLFLHQKPHHVAGMVLVESGQETALSAQTEEEQYRRQILGDAPLSVVRGNLMRAKQDAWVKAAATARSDVQKAQLEPQRLMLEKWAEEDERLKRKQLGLSRVNRYCQVPRCGPHPILERPEAVVEEVRWVMGELAASGARQAQYNAAPSRPVSGLRRGLSTRLASGLQRTFSKKERT